VPAPTDRPIRMASIRAFGRSAPTVWSASVSSHAIPVQVATPTATAAMRITHQRNGRIDGREPCDARPRQCTTSGTPASPPPATTKPVGSQRIRLSHFPKRSAASTQNSNRPASTSAAPTAPNATARRHHRCTAEAVDSSAIRRSWPNRDAMQSRIARIEPFVPLPSGGSVSRLSMISPFRSPRLHSRCRGWCVAVAPTRHVTATASTPTLTGAD